MTEREAFEAWAKKAGWPHHFTSCSTKDPNGYSQESWEAWQAARAQPAQAGQVLTLDEVRESVHEAGLDWHNGWTMGEDAENRYLNLCRAIESAVLAKLAARDDTALIRQLLSVLVWEAGSAQSVWTDATRKAITAARKRLGEV